MDSGGRHGGRVGGAGTRRRRRRPGPRGRLPAVGVLNDDDQFGAAGRLHRVAHHAAAIDDDHHALSEAGTANQSQTGDQRHWLLHHDVFAPVFVFRPGAGQTAGGEPTTEEDEAHLDDHDDHLSIDDHHHGHDDGHHRTTTEHHRGLPATRGGSAPAGRSADR